MCGRYVRRSDKQRIARHFHVYGPSVPDFAPSWNVAPQTFQPIIRLNRDTREREIVMIRWTNSEAAHEVSENGCRLRGSMQHHLK